MNENDAKIEEELEESSPVAEEVIDDIESSSDSDLAEPTAEQGGQEPLHENPRFKEVISQKNKAAEEAAYWRGQAEANKSQPVQDAPEVDPYQDQDAQTKLYHQQRDTHTQQMIEKALKAKDAQYQSVIEKQTRVVGELQARMYRQDNVDVPKGSEEEMAIAEKIRNGYTLEDATWSVMGKKRVAEAGKRVQQKKVDKKVMKAQANLATASNAVDGALPSPNTSFRDSVSKKFADMGL